MEVVPIKKSFRLLADSEASCVNELSLGIVSDTFAIVTQRRLSLGQNESYVKADAVV